MSCDSAESLVHMQLFPFRVMLIGSSGADWMRLWSTNGQLPIWGSSESRPLRALYAHDARTAAAVNTRWAVECAIIAASKR